VLSAILLPLDLGVVTGLVMAWPVLALAIAYRLFNFPDLTVEGSFAVGAAAFAAAAQSGWSAPSALALAACAGAVLGAMTAAIHVWFRLNKFLAAIIVVAMSYTFCLRVMAGPNIGLISANSPFAPARGLDDAVPGAQLGTLALLALLLVVGLALIRLTANSAWGLRLRAVGSNPTHGESIGLGTGRYLMAGLAGTNALAAAGGALLASYQGFADVAMGQGCLILALASLTIGERLVPQRRLTIPGYVLAAAALGAVAYQIVSVYALRAGLASTDLKLATALFVLGVVALRRRHRSDPMLEGTS
jgi:putative ABC transport system permease protein